GVAGVQFTLDGAPLGAEDTAAPYATTWNTTTASNGSHTLSAVARDAAGNMATATPVTVTVNNGPPSDTTPPTVVMTAPASGATDDRRRRRVGRSEEHTSELQSRGHLVCRLLLEKK